MEKKINVAFFGSWHHAPIVFRSVVTEPYFEIKLAVTGGGKDDTPNPIKRLSQERKIPVYFWNRTEDVPALSGKLKQLEPDFLVVADFGHIIPKPLLEVSRFGAVNIHPSLLPRHRGTSPAQSAILNGDTEIGVSLIQMDEKMDHGPLLAQARLPLPPAATAPELYKTLFTLGAKMLPEVLCLACNGGLLRGRLGRTTRLGTASRRPSPRSPRKIARFFYPPQEQNHAQATYTKMLKKEDGRIDWSKSPAEIERMIRAYDGWPGCWTTLAELVSARSKIENLKFKNDQRRVKILKTHLHESGALQIDQLQIEGKKPISWEEFARGYL